MVMCWSVINVILFFVVAGYVKIQTKSYRDKFTRIRKEFERIYKLSQVDESVLSSKYLDGTLNFLKAKFENDENYIHGVAVSPAEVQQGKSNDSSVAFEFPPISLLSSSDSDTDSATSTATEKEAHTNEVLSNRKEKTIKKLPCIDKLRSESEENFSETTEKTTGKTIVTLDMIEALLRSKTDSSSLDTGGSLASYSDDQNDAATHQNLTLPIFKHHSNFDKRSVSGPNTSTFMQNADSTSSVILVSHPRTITNTQADIKSTNDANISMAESNCNSFMVSNHENYDSSINEANKKEISSILDINSEAEDIELFLNEVADYVSSSYTVEQQSNIRLKICALVTAAEIEEIDEQCDSPRADIKNENLAMDQLSDSSTDSFT